MLVLLGHFARDLYTLFPKLSCMSWLVRTNNFAVTAFFLLSGYILMATWERKVTTVSFSTYKDYIIGRTWRLYPAYFAALTALVVSRIIFDHFGLRGIGAGYSRLPVEYLMVHMWWPSSGLGWNYPAWSMSVVWWISLFWFPPLFLLFRNARSKKFLIAATLGLIVIQAVIRAKLPHDWFWFVSRVLFPFTTGIFLNRLRQVMDVPGAIIANVVAIGSVVLHFGTLYLFGDGSAWMTFVIIGTVSSTVLSLTWPKNLVANFLDSRIFCSLGKISYSIYLSHCVANGVLMRILPIENYAHASFAVRSAVLSAYMAGFALAAILLYKLVEGPCEEYRKRVEAEQRSKSMPVPPLEPVPRAAGVEVAPVPVPVFISKSSSL
jgi:peptidoglycan/LPS O-acetylase OafA/YrhL